jgi:hypothetical protein
MGLVDKARMLESRIAGALHRAAADVVGAGGREPLAIVLAIVEEIDRQTQPGSRGTRVFPFNHATVTVLAPSRESRVRFEALFAATPSLSERVLDRLRRSGCDAGGVHIDVEYAARPGRHWRDPAFDVAFDRVAIGSEQVPPPETKTPTIELAVIRGTAERRSYSLTLQRIDVGRGSEVRDGRHRLVRSNHVVFVEGTAGINETVSRCHAHLAVDAVSAVVRIHDDGSAHGTELVRGGRTIPVPPGSRGVRVRGGDELVLGEARLRVRFVDPRR